jgi:nitroreductase
MQTWDAMRARRNVRAYADRPIPADLLDRILEAGRRAPSAGNSQPWDFVVVTDRDQLIELSKVWTYGSHVARSAATIALVTGVVTEGRQRELIQYDLGQATMSMMVAAADLGIGTGHSSVADQDLARSVLGLPPDRSCAYLVTAGYPADRPLRPIARPSRRPFDDVVHRGRW